MFFTVMLTRQNWPCAFAKPPPRLLAPHLTLCTTKENFPSRTSSPRPGPCLAAVVAGALVAAFVVALLEDLVVVALLVGGAELVVDVAVGSSLGGFAMLLMMP